ncbi:alpha/beta-hydrolase [Thozetella sp. PMI_491]|nr:alpha/beta-hydrolase [Thozetella sp. PMI_491]
MAPSHIFFAPGMFTGPAPFEPCAALLRAAGFTTHLGRIRTTNTKSPGNPTIADNLEQFREDITAFVEEAGEAEVIVFCHSAAGHYCSGALKDLGVQQRKSNGRSGGVAHLIFLAAIITPKGVSVATLQAAGVVSVQGGQIFIKDPLKVFFHDLPTEEAQAWATRVLPEPTEGWEKPITYMGWRDIPSHYIICEDDQMIPALVQEQLGTLAGSALVRMPGGHFPQLSRPAELAHAIQQIASELK